MTISVPAKVLSPVNVEERQKLDVRAGDTVRVHQKIEEKGKTRMQVFEGLVLARKHKAEPGATFTVRATLSGVGVEKIFPLYSPLIERIEIVRRSKVPRAKLYYIRDKAAREQRRGLRKMSVVSISTIGSVNSADTVDTAGSDSETSSAETKETE